MKNANYTKLIAIAAFSLALSACSKKEESKPAEPVAQETAPAAETPPTPAEKPAEPAADEGADFVRVLATHKKTNEQDPVVISIANFAVTKSEFDPANLEGASAEITLELGSINSGIEKRDGHLKSPDYLDVAKSPQVVIKVSGVKKAGEAYEASAEVAAHGLTKTMPVSFKVLKSDESSVQVEASKEFDRTDFGIDLGEEDQSAPGMKIEMRLTLKKS